MGDKKLTPEKKRKGTEKILEKIENLREDEEVDRKKTPNLAKLVLDEKFKHIGNPPGKEFSVYGKGDERVWYYPKTVEIGLRYTSK